MDSGNTLLLHMDYDWEEVYGPLVCNIDSRVYVLPAGQPVEVPENEMRMIDGHEYRYNIAEAILAARGMNHGIVRVPQVQETVSDSKGRRHLVVSYELDKAQEDAVKLLEEIGDRMIYSEYIPQQQQRIKEAGPAGAQPPTGRVALFIQKRGIDLTQYNIAPPGWDRKTGISTAQVASENEALKAELSELRKMVEKMAKAAK